MKSTFILVILLVLSTCHVYAQDAPKVKFGKVSEEELNMKVYTPDTAAAAVILYDDGNSSVNYDVSKDKFMLTFERFVRIKILKESGKEWGTHQVSLYSFNQTKEEILGGIDGITYNLENGKVVKSVLKKDGVFLERENKYWESTKISLPAVKVGSVIDIKYTISSPLLWNLQTWKFQYSIPVKWSHLYLKYPEYFKYNHTSLGYYPLFSNKHETTNEKINFTVRYESTGTSLNGGGRRQLATESISYNAHTFDYAAKDMPAIKEEPYCSTIENFTTKLKFELAATDFIGIGGAFKDYTSTWQSISKELMDDEDFGGQIKGGNFIEDNVNNITKGVSGEMNKMRALYSYLQKNIKWDKFRAYSTSKSLKKTFTDQTGNSADLNLLLLVMLQKAGISADPVILSTRDHGMLNPAHPSLSDCNYVIVKATIDNSTVFLDVTDPVVPAGQLPMRCMNGKGVLITPDNPGEIPLTQTPSISSSAVMFELKDGQLHGSVVTRLGGLAAYSFRNEVKDAGGNSDHFEGLKNKSKEIEYVDFTYNNLDSLYLPVEKRYNFLLNDGSFDDNSIIYMSPVIFEKWLQNPFSSPDRLYPVDFGIPFSESYTMNFTIPEGYQVEELPKNKNIMMPEKGGRFIYAIEQKDNRIVLNLRFSIDRSLFIPSEYPNLKDFFDRVIAAEGEQIVLKKI